MKKAFLLFLCFSALNVAAQFEIDNNDPVILNNQSDSLNYFLGLSLGYDLKTAPFDVDPKLISNGLHEAYKESPVYDQQTSQQIMRQLQMAVTQKESAKVNQAAQENLDKGTAFLLKNGKRDEVTTTESGLQYEVLEWVDGPMPADTSTVTVHYEGKLVDGTIFDSSYERGEPISFPLNGVIQGWTEGVQLMPTGSTFTLYIPSALGYGPRDQGPIPANSVLIFKIELLEFK